MYGNYPSYNPMPDPTIAAMQERLAKMQQQQTYRPIPPQPVMPYGGIKGRMVTSVDEARAAQIDFDGSMNYFPAPAEGKIYVKSIGLDGLPVFEVYQRVDAAPKQQAYVESSAFIALQQRVEQLEAALKGANNNVQPYAVNANNEQPQPAGTNAADVRQQPGV